MIDEIYQKEKKYTKRQVDRVDMVHSSKLIFDLSKARPLDGGELEEERLRSWTKLASRDQAGPAELSRTTSEAGQAVRYGGDYGVSAQHVAAGTRPGGGLLVGGATGPATGRSTADSRMAAAAASQDFIKGMQIQVSTQDRPRQPFGKARH